MRQRIKDRMTYANVTASLALFIALGGSSYAALTLPRDSVGSNQIRARAVRSSELRDGSVTLKDINRGARLALHGAAGKTGATGPPGAAATRYFAAVSAAGAFVRGDATNGGRAGAIGSYVVGFSGSTSTCAAAATLGTTDASTTVPGRITTNDQAGRVGVQTYDASGAPADLPFQVVVAC